MIVESKNKYWDINRSLYDQIRQQIKIRIIDVPLEERLEIYSDALFILMDQNIMKIEKEMKLGNDRAIRAIPDICLRLNSLTQKAMILQEERLKIGANSDP